MTERDLFIAALQIDDPAERAAYLDQGCGGDQELRDRLDVLLDAHDQPSSVLEDLPAGNLEQALLATEPDETAAGSEPLAAEVEQTASHHHDATAPAALIGSIIAGRYKLRQEIGEGGMGSVYLAEQTQPVKRQVALKLIKPGMDSRTVLARFESERQALALMDHPNIAKVLDAGTTETRPAVLRHGAGQGDSAHRLLRPAPAGAAGTPERCSARSVRRCSMPIKRGSSTAT